LQVFFNPRFQHLLQAAGVFPGATVGELFLGLAGCPPWIIAIVLAVVVAIVLAAIAVIKALFGWHACRIGATLVRETVDNSDLPTSAFQEAVDRIFKDSKPTAGDKTRTAEWVAEQIKGETVAGRKARLQALADAITNSPEPK
jgi:hypothetical protein